MRGFVEWDCGGVGCAGCVKIGLRMDLWVDLRCSKSMIWVFCF